MHAVVVRGAIGWLAPRHLNDAQFLPAIDHSARDIEVAQPSMDPFTRYPPPLLLSGFLRGAYSLSFGPSNLVVNDPNPLYVESGNSDSVTTKEDLCRK